MPPYCCWRIISNAVLNILEYISCRSLAVRLKPSLFSALSTMALLTESGRPVLVALGSLGRDKLWFTRYSCTHSIAPSVCCHRGRSANKTKEHKYHIRLERSTCQLQLNRFSRAKHNTYRKKIYAKRPTFIEYQRVLQGLGRYIGKHLLVTQQSCARHHFFENRVMCDHPQSIWIQLVGCNKS